MNILYPKKYPWLFGLLLLCFSFSSSYATHIVGGEIGYRCLGNDQYEISLRVFRDCDTGVPWFDNPASVGVFDANDSLIFDLRLMMRENDTLDLNLSDPCLVAPPNVCIHTTSYLDTVTLPFQPGGYQLVYQRCCRNQDIVNIVNPLGTGATYYCLITEDALTGCNSSAVFRDWPPVYICNGTPIYFDHSATDADGDSLVYEMCTPLDGASPPLPMPQPPFNPPYNPVTWGPGFGVNNMLGGTDTLRIDPHTGLLQGTPAQLGVYVVGICVKEYRNGQLISTSRRDFQYAIGICGRLVSSAFFAPEIQCDNSLLVQFQNNSTSLGTGYFWDFGDTTTGATSTLDNPVYIYPDTGTYEIMLVADPGTLCSDTAYQTINLQYESILMDFDLATANCTDSLTVIVSDLTVDTISTIVDWNWDFGNGQTASIPFASTVYNQSGTYIITLDVEAANGCTATLHDTISISLPNISSSDTVAICPGQSNITLNPGGDPTHQYQWAPASGLSCTTCPSPVANPTSTSTYQVTVTAFNGVDTCVLQDEVTVVLADPINLQPLPDTTTCSDSLWLEAIVSQNATIEWAFDGGFNPLYSTQNPVQVPVSPAPSFTTIYIRATDAYGCQETGSMQIFGQNIPINADFSYQFAGCGENLTVQFNDQTTDTSQGPIVNWSWGFGDGNFSNQQNPIHNYTSSGSYVASLWVTSSQGCMGLHVDTIENITLPQLTGADTVGICSGQISVELNAGGDTTLSYQWAPATNLSCTTCPSPIASPPGAADYTVTITAINGNDTCVNVDSVHVGYPPIINVNVPDYQYCGNSVTMTATSNYAVQYEWSTDPSFFTIVGTTNPITVFPPTNPSGYYVRATDNYGCTATDFSLLQQIATNVNVNFGWQALSCEDTLQIQFTNLTTDTVGTTIDNVVWTVSDGQTSTQNNPVFTFTQGGIYTVELQVNLANGCFGVFAQTLDLNVASITSPSTIALCGTGQTVTLNPGGDTTGMQYQWAPATGLSSTTAASPVATPPSLPFTYTITVTALNSFDTCVAIHDITIIDPPPLFVNVPNDTTFCNSQYLLYANVSPTMRILDWAQTPDFSNPILQNVNPVSITFGTFPSTFILYARVRDQYGCEAIDTAVLNYSTAPINVNFQAVAQGCNPDSLVVQFTDLTSDTTFGTINNWNWNFGDGNTSSQQNPSHTYTASGSTPVVTLSINLSNGCSGAFTDSLDYQLPDFVGPDSVGLCGSSNPIILNPGGNPNLIYQWAPPTGLSSTTSPSPILTPTTNTNYTVTITAPNNGDTCVAVQNMVVRIDSFAFEAMPDTLLCTNSVNLFVNSPGATNVEWALDPNFNLILGSGNPFFTNINSSRWFYVRGENAFGCTAVDSVFIGVRLRDVNVNFAMNPLNCGDSLLIDFVDLTTDTVGNPISNWNWYFGTGDSSTIQNPSYNYTQAGNYTVTLEVLTANGCPGSLSQPLSFGLPALHLANDTVVSCGGAPVALNPGGDTSLSYQWSPASGLSNPNSANPLANPTGQQTYTVTVTAINQLGSLTDTCTLVQSVTVAVPPPISVQASGDSIACSLNVQLTATSGTGTNFLWADDGNFNNLIGNGASISTTQNNLTQYYYVQATDAFGCIAIDSVLIEQRAPALQIDSASISCPNEPAELTVLNLNANDQLSYVWSPDSLIESGQGTASITTAPANPTIFSVLVTNQYGCTDSLSALVNVSSSFPALDIQAQPDTIFVGESAQLIATENGTYTYTWNPDPSLSNTTIFNPLATPENPTLYILEVVDPSGCKNRDSITIYTKNFICEEPYVFVPNTFTPNGDNLNDILFVRGNVITELYFAVYNRWGELIFETNDQSRGWDGTFKGKALSPDVYGYYLRYKCVGQGAEDDFQFKKGNITLLR